MATDIEKVREDQTAVANEEADNKNPIFDALVTADSEISGLVAYPLYKQNKRSWIEDFKRVTGRLPNEAETRAYIIGESTERRLATYRLLAQTTLGGRSRAEPQRKSMSVAAALWVLILLVVLAGVGYVLHAYGVIPNK
jgi:hypothetical protein